MRKIYTLLLSAVLLLSAGCTDLLGNLGNLGMGQGTGNESGNGTLGDVLGGVLGGVLGTLRSEEHTSELQSR